MLKSFGDTTIYLDLKSRDAEFLGVIDQLVPIVATRLESQVPKLFPDFTLHNIHHSVRVAEYMAEIIGDLSEFNELELSLMLLGALLHDLGMALGKEELQQICEGTFFTDGSIDYQAYVKVFDLNADQEIVRRYHAEISSQLIGSLDFPGKFILNEPRGVSYLRDVQLLCQSHTKDHLWLRESLQKHNILGKYTYNLQFIAQLLRLADLLDIDQSRTPIELYKLILPAGRSEIEWQQHFVITNTKKIELDRNSGTRKVVLYGRSDDIKIHRKLLSYIKWIDTELLEFLRFSESLEEKRYKINLSNQVDHRIVTEGFTVSDYRLSLDFASITELLMGDNIYGDKKLGLREIVQNAIDTCLVRHEVEKRLEHDYEPIIKIIISTKENLFTISDNGLGMSEDIIKKFFLNIGKSYYRSDIFKLNNYSYSPIGYFGIGFLACFMLSEEVLINTRHYLTNSKHTIQLEKGNEYIGFNTVDDVAFSGTEIQLSLDKVLGNFAESVAKVKEFFLKYFVTDYFRLRLIVDGTGEDLVSSIYDKDQLPTKDAFKTGSCFDPSNYLNDVIGYFVLRNRHDFVRSVNDLRVRGNNYYYIENGEVTRGVLKFENVVNISKGMIRYLHIPLYTNSKRDEFITALRILDDINATMDKVDRDDDLYVFVPVNEQDTLYDEDIFTTKDHRVVGDVELNNLLGEEFEDYFCPKIDVIELRVVGDDSLKLMEVFKPVQDTFWGRDQEKLFLRNIFVIRYSFGKVLVANTINLVEFKLNYLGNNLILKKSTCFAGGQFLNGFACKNSLISFSLINGSVETSFKAPFGG